MKWPWKKNPTQPKNTSKFGRLGHQLNKYKIITFFMTLLGIGMLQYWAVFIALSSIGKNTSWALFFKDGGLLFFSSSLIASSFLELLEKADMRPGGLDLTITFIAGFAPVFVILTMYASVAAQDPRQDFEPLWLVQLGMTFVSIAYATYTGVRLGKFIQAEA